MSQIGVKLHERWQQVQQAKHKLGLFVLELEGEFNLSYAEVIKILADELSSTTTYAIRIERHGTTSKKGDEAEG